MRKMTIGIALLVLMASLIGCADVALDSETADDVQQEQHVISGARTQITDATLQQEVLELVLAAEQESIDNGEAQGILRSPLNNAARTIEFRIDAMWYSFHETGVLTVHRAGSLAEYFLLTDEDMIQEIFLEYAE